MNPIPVLAERLKIYESALKDAGHQRPDDWLAAALMVFVGRDRAQVRATIEPSLRNYFNAVSEIIEPESLAANAQAEFQKVRNRLRTIDYSTVDSIMGIFGDPEYCIDRIAQLKEQFGFSRLVCWFEIGGISGHQNVLAAMRLFADRVMPKFQLRRKSLVVRAHQSTGEVCAFAGATSSAAPLASAPRALSTCPRVTTAWHCASPRAS